MLPWMAYIAFFPTVAVLPWMPMVGYQLLLPWMLIVAFFPIDHCWLEWLNQTYCRLECLLLLWMPNVALNGLYCLFSYCCGVALNSYGCLLTTIALDVYCWLTLILDFDFLVFEFDLSIFWFQFWFRFRFLWFSSSIF